MCMLKSGVAGSAFRETRTLNKCTENYEMIGDWRLVLWLINFGLLDTSQSTSRVNFFDNQTNLILCICVVHASFYNMTITWSFPYSLSVMTKPMSTGCRHRAKKQRKLDFQQEKCRYRHRAKEHRKNVGIHSVGRWEKISKLISREEKVLFRWMSS